MLVEGVDLSADLSQQAVDRLGELLVEHQILFFRDQPITPQVQVRFDHPKVPIHPTRQESRELTKCQAVVFVEAPDSRKGGGHLAQHAHHEHDDRAGQCERENRSGSGRLDDNAATDEETRPYDAPEGDHLDVPTL